MINRTKYFDQLIKFDIKNLKITAIQGEDYTTGFLIDYTCFQKKYKLIAIDVG